MKKFDIKEAKEGNPVITRDEKEAKILLFDRSSNNFPIVAIIENKTVLYYNENGTFYLDKESENDLFMK
jgi:hypothetical protein